MHTGHFPTSPTSPSYCAGAWSPDDLDPQPKRLDRRHLMIGIACAFAGAAIPVGLGLARSGVRGGGSPPARAPSRATPKWAKEMWAIPDRELLERAGEFEMHSCRHVGETTLAGGFVRLLRVAAASRHAHRDVAAACAVRSLARLGDIAAVAQWSDRLEADVGLPQAAAAAHAELAEDALLRRARGR